MKTLLPIIFIFINSSVFAEIIQYELINEIRPRVDIGYYWQYNYTSKTNSLIVAEGKSLQVIDFFPVYGWGSGNVVTRIKSKYGTSTNTVEVWSVGNNSGSYGTSPVGKTFVGPCVLEITLDDYRENYIEKSNNWIPGESRVLYRFEMTDRSGGSSQLTALVPSASVVVPANATGDVDVLLEQSTDMITWTQCLPGTYNASTQKRFFRVRAVEK